MGEETQGLECGRLYIDGQPVEWNERLPELEPAGELPEEAKPLLTVPDSMELTLTIKPETAAAIVEALKPVIEASILLFGELAKKAGEAIRKVLTTITPIADNLMERMLYEANDNPKWWYLYKHAKKHRTRKKYRRLLMQQLLSKQRAASTQEVDV